MLSIKYNQKTKRTKSIKHLLSVFLLISMALSFVTLGAFTAGAVPAPQKKVSICHKDDLGVYHLISINQNAYSTHMNNHGDGEPGKTIGNTVFANDCTTSALYYTAYNTIPSPLPANFPSQPFEAQSASEFGGQIALTGMARTNPKITIIMSSWGCESGDWVNNNCVTSAGATFSVPITLNLYNVGTDNSVGSLVATTTRTFDIPYRPSLDPICGNGRWSTDGTLANCFNGFATPISFDLSSSGIVLPGNVIVSLAYNTSHHGYEPIGDDTECYVTSGGCGYDSLNVALGSMDGVSYPIPDGAYFNSTYAPFYGDAGTGGVGTFRLDPSGWAGYQPVISVITKM